ncbi:MarR family winged helix-turn-helix transcriptional regulator [Roseobacter sp. HKCCA0434]|uniref:MarR family winged helix-turn-helix transcriptional regulator n=1 Tax=Roseobacter sp. HKCCA0434 TaxID=3079297 RepID=UPI002905E683|nr:MarR family transcriptional regulator [Roseobacter sp. HKCCA0434]
MTIPLTVLLQSASQSVLSDVVADLRADGFDHVSESHLILMGNLDCGTTQATRIAERMQVSRQAISRGLRDLQALGLVVLRDDPTRGNAKIVTMTPEGERLALAARAALARVEAKLADRIGAEAVTALRGALERGWGMG